MVTIARNAGNIWMINRNRSPGRRPAKRNRENAYAANVDSESAMTVDPPEMMSEFRNQRAKSVRAKRFVKLLTATWLGTSAVELNVPSGLNAADTTNRIGISAKTIAARATTWRQPTLLNQL